MGLLCVSLLKRLGSLQEAERVMVTEMASINGKETVKQTEGELLRPRIRRTETVCSCEEAYECQFTSVAFYIC